MQLRTFSHLVGFMLALGVSAPCLGAGALLEVFAELGAELPHMSFAFDRLRFASQSGQGAASQLFLPGKVSPGYHAVCRLPGVKKPQLVTGQFELRMQLTYRMSGFVCWSRGPQGQILGSRSYRIMHRMLPIYQPPRQVVPQLHPKVSRNRPYVYRSVFSQIPGLIWQPEQFALSTQPSAWGQRIFTRLAGQSKLEGPPIACQLAGLKKPLPLPAGGFQFEVETTWRDMVLQCTGRGSPPLQEHLLIHWPFWQVQTNPSDEDEEGEESDPLDAYEGRKQWLLFDVGLGAIYHSYHEQDQPRRRQVSAALGLGLLLPQVGEEGRVGLMAWTDLAVFMPPQDLPLFVWSAADLFYQQVLTAPLFAAARLGLRLGVQAEKVKVDDASYGYDAMIAGYLGPELIWPGHGGSYRMGVEAAPILSGGKKGVLLRWALSFSAAPRASQLYWSWVADGGSWSADGESDSDRGHADKAIAHKKIRFVMGLRI